MEEMLSLVLSHVGEINDRTKRIEEKVEAIDTRLKFCEDLLCLVHLPQPSAAGQEGEVTIVQVVDEVAEQVEEARWEEEAVEMREDPIPDHQVLEPDREGLAEEVVDKVVPYMSTKRTTGKLSEVQSAYFNFQLDDMDICSSRGARENARQIIGRGEEEGVWAKDWRPEGIEGTFEDFMTEKIRARSKVFKKTLRACKSKK